MPKVVPEYKEEARSRILQTASKLFIEQGFQKTNMNQIAKQLGVSKGAIYLYFPSKEALLIEVMKDSSIFRKSSLFSDLGSNELSMIASVDFFRRIVASSEQVNKLGVELASQALYKPELLGEFRSFYRDEIDIIASYFDRLKQERGVNGDLDSRTLALSILALRSGLRGFLSTESEETVFDTWRFMIGLIVKELEPNL